MGDRMEIKYDALPSASNGWTDGLHWLQEVSTWSEEFERKHMVPADSNHRLALAHLDVILLNLPNSLKIAGRHVVSYISGERLRRAIMLVPPPLIVTSTLDALLSLRKVFLGYFCLPRPDWMRTSYISATTESNGRYSAKEYVSHPWYVKPTLTRRWGLSACLTRLLGRKVPGDDGDKYCPEGYIISQVGPESVRGKGMQDLEIDIGKITTQGVRGCPFGIRK